jgi:hypothetical protein
LLTRVLSKNVWTLIPGPGESYHGQVGRRRERDPLLLVYKNVIP